MIAAKAQLLLKILSVLNVSVDGSLARSSTGASWERSPSSSWEFFTKQHQREKYDGMDWGREQETGSFLQMTHLEVSVSRVTDIANGETTYVCKVPFELFEH